LGDAQRQQDAGQQEQAVDEVWQYFHPAQPVELRIHHAPNPAHDKAADTQ
jgi:hypothetical protein